MPSARTYQAIGFATYHGGRFWGKAKRAELERKLQRRRKVRNAAVAGAAVAVIAVGAAAVAARGRPVTV